MALKTNFEATSDVASPFIDEVANPGNLNAQGLAHDREKLRQTRRSAFELAATGGRSTEGIQRIQMLTKRIKDRKTAARLRKERATRASHPTHENMAGHNPGE